MTNTRNLRLALKANAAFSIAGGLVAVIGGSWISREFGIDHVVLTEALGLGLVVFGAFVFQVSLASDRTVVKESALISAGDIGWVIGSVVVILTGVLTTTGNVTTGIVALAVADFATTQLIFRHKATAQNAHLTEGVRTVAA